MVIGLHGRFEHHHTAFEVDQNAKLFNDWPSHQHWRPALDDERLRKTRRAVDKDGIVAIQWLVVEWSLPKWNVLGHRCILRESTG